MAECEIMYLKDVTDKLGIFINWNLWILKDGSAMEMRRIEYLCPYIKKYIMPVGYGRSKAAAEVDLVKNIRGQVLFKNRGGNNEVKFEVPNDLHL